MNWIVLFELVCYAIFIMAIICFIKQKDYRSLFTVGAGSLVGIFVELFLVTFNGAYSYSNDYLLVLGSSPNHFPVCGAVMWGALLAYSIKIAKKFKFNKPITSLIAGILIVSMDISLDVIAVRLNGGFWIWEGSPIDLSISSQGLMGVAWGNYLGYLIMVPVAAYLTLRAQERIGATDFKKQTLYMFVNFVCSLVITMVGSSMALWLDDITNGWFAFILFPSVWIGMAVVIGLRAYKGKAKLAKIKDWDWPMVIFWTAQHVYNLSAVVYLNIQATHMWFLILGILCMVGTVLACIMAPLKEADFAIDRKQGG